MTFTIQNGEPVIGSGVGFERIDALQDIWSVRLIDSTMPKERKSMTV